MAQSASIDDSLELALLHEAGLPAAAARQPILLKGFANQVCILDLADQTRVVMRINRHAGADAKPEHFRAQFLARNRVPAPRLFASVAREGVLASLFEFAEGAVLRDLINSRQVDERVWQNLGRAYRRVHDVKFPDGLAGVVGPDSILCWQADPIAELRGKLRGCEARLAETYPAAHRHLGAIGSLVDQCADVLRAAPSALLHGDTNVGNALVSSERAVLIDWDQPAIGDPARELARLDFHVSLFHDTGLPMSFFDGYGAIGLEPNTSIWRIVQTISEAATFDLTEDQVAAQLRPALTSTLKALADYMARLPEHLTRLREHVATGAVMVHPEIHGDGQHSRTDVSEHASDR